MAHRYRLVPVGGVSGLGGSGAIGATVVRDDVVPAIGPAIEGRSLYRFFRAGDEETTALCGVSLSVASG
jgi:putative ABC transport system ATP-binding protein